MKIISQYIIEKLKINKDTKLDDLVFDNFIYSLFNIEKKVKIDHILYNWVNVKKNSKFIVSSIYTKDLDDFQKLLNDNNINNIEINTTDLSGIMRNIKKFFYNYPSLERHLAYSDKKNIQIYISKNALYITNRNLVDNYSDMKYIFIEKQ